MPYYYKTISKDTNEDDGLLFVPTFKGVIEAFVFSFFLKYRLKKISKEEYQIIFEEKIEPQWHKKTPIE